MSTSKDNQEKDKQKVAETSAFINTVNMVNAPGKPQLKDIRNIRAKS
jgi:hypothetical protein